MTLSSLGPAATIVAALGLFFIVFFLGKGRIRLSGALILVVAVIAADLAFERQHGILSFLSLSTHPEKKGESNEEDFHAQVLSAIEELKTEAKTEKESLQRVMGQMQEVFDSVEIQKQKLQTFINEMHVQFQQETPLPEHQ